MTKDSEALKKHYEWAGKIEVVSRAPVTNREDLALSYTPGVADACMRIADNPEEAYKLTRKNNLVAVITNGTAVLGSPSCDACYGRKMYLTKRICGC